LVFYIPASSTGDFTQSYPHRREQDSIQDQAHIQKSSHLCVMDPVINVVHPTSDSVGGQLQENHSRETRGLIEEYSRQLEEMARTRDTATAEIIRVTEERDAIKVTCDAKAQHIKDLLQTLEKTTAELKQTKKQFKDASKKWEEEKSKLERRYEKFKDEVTEENARIQRDASESKSSHEQWKRKYSAALAEKIELLHQYAVSLME
jgi:chromosome segregation ATPase